jgi:hypothetical protein
MKPLLLLTLVCLTGCSNLSKVVKELAKDPNTVAISLTTVYGTLHIVRTGITNQQVNAGPVSVK